MNGILILNYLAPFSIHVGKALPRDFGTYLYLIQSNHMQTKCARSLYDQELILGFLLISADKQTKVFASQ